MKVSWLGLSGWLPHIWVFDKSSSDRGVTSFKCMYISFVIGYDILATKKYFIKEGFIHLILYICIPLRLFRCLDFQRRS